MLYGMELIDAIRQAREVPPSGIRTLGLDRTHRWIEEIRPGFVRIAYSVDSDHANAEGAVICSWITALADQAIFFASNTLCGPGESTRMKDLRLTCVCDILDGTVYFDAAVRSRAGDKMYCRCDIVGPDGLIHAEVAAVIEVLLAK